jgi:hypothetical protein
VQTSVKRPNVLGLLGAGVLVLAALALAVVVVDLAQAPDCGGAFDPEGCLQGSHGLRWVLVAAGIGGALVWLISAFATAAAALGGTRIADSPMTTSGLVLGSMLGGVSVALFLNQGAALT